MNPNFRPPVLFMYERLAPPGFHAGSAWGEEDVGPVGG